jgi:hypothetical protein
MMDKAVDYEAALDSLAAQPAVTPWYRLWASLGVVFLVIMAITQGRWVLSPAFTPSPIGTDPMPAQQAVLIYTMQAVSLTWFLAVMWFFVIRPVVRTGVMSIDGKIALGMGTCWWLDAMYNYVQLTWYYNAHTVNMGSWGGFLPGSIAPGQDHFPEPLLNAAFLWYGSFATFGWLGSQLYGWVRQKLGPDSPFLAAFILYATFVVIDILFQNSYIRTGNFGYAATWGRFTMFAGTRYQYPLYEALVYSACLVSISLLRSHLNQAGESAVEIGLSRAGFSKTKRNVLGTLSVVGFCQVIVLFVWMLPYEMFALHVDTFAPLPSYLRAGMCGNGTPIACADGSFGIPTVGMAPAFVVRPDDPHLSHAAKAAQGE